MGFFALEGPFMRFFDKVFNLLWLNIIVIIFCLPVFTAGAAFTAMHYVLLRMLHNEEGYVLPGFIKSFRENFKQATLIWLPYMVITFALAVDTYLVYKGTVTLTAVYKLGLYFLLFVAALGLMFVFPVLSHYSNTIKGTVVNAYAMAVYSPIRSLAMLALCIAPWVAAAFVPNFIFICVLYGFTLPGFLCASLYDGVFRRFEKEEQKARERAAEAAAAEAEAAEAAEAVVGEAAEAAATTEAVVGEAAGTAATTEAAGEEAGTAAITEEAEAEETKAADAVAATGKDTAEVKEPEAAEPKAAARESSSNKSRKSKASSGTSSKRSGKKKRSNS